MFSLNTRVFLTILKHIKNKNKFIAVYNIWPCQLPLMYLIEINFHLRFNFFNPISPRSKPEDATNNLFLSTWALTSPNDSFYLDVEFVILSLRILSLQCTEPAINIDDRNRNFGSKQLRGLDQSSNWLCFNHAIMAWHKHQASDLNCALFISELGLQRSREMIRLVLMGTVFRAQTEKSFGWNYDPWVLDWVH